jgi:hypothetical protein
MIEGAELMSWSPDGAAIAVTTEYGVALLNSASLEVIAFKQTDRAQHAVAFADDGTKLATADGSMEHPLAEAAPVGTIPLSDGIAGIVRFPHRLTISHDNWLVASGTEIPEPGIGIWELVSGELVGMLTREELEGFAQLSFNPTKYELAILLNDRRLQIWRIQE